MGHYAETQFKFCNCFYVHALNPLLLLKLTDEEEEHETYSALPPGMSVGKLLISHSLQDHYINPLCEVYRRRKVKWIPLPDVCRFLEYPCRFCRTSMDLSAFSKFDSLKPTETHC